MTPLLSARTGALLGAIIAGVAVTLAGCTKQLPLPTNPTAGLPIKALHISGPESLAPGDTGQFTAIADLDDGTSQDVTSQAKWQLTLANGITRFSIGAGGIAHVDPRAEAGYDEIKATLNGVNSPNRKVSILPPGTFRLSGAITEEGRPAAFDVAVEITAGTGVGVGARAIRRGDDPGHYDFYGVAGDLEVRASADGYEPQVHRITVTGTATTDFDLHPSEAAANISGAWTMTVSASSKCAGILTAEAAERVLGVQVVQQGGNVEATFSGPTIYSGLNARHLGKVLGHALSVTIDSVEFDTYQLAYVFDRLGPTQWLGISGTVKGTVAEPEFSAVLVGNLDLYTAPAGVNFPPGPPTGPCFAEHGVVLRRK